MADTPDPITKKLDSLHEKAKAARRAFEPEWFMNLAYFEGRHWLKWSGGQLQSPQLAPDRMTVTENRVTGIIRTELSKMTKNRPVWTCVPNSGDEEDHNATDVAEKVMEFLWDHLKMPELSLKALGWSRVVCAGFLKCYWDSTIGDAVPVLIGPDGQVLEDPESGKPMRGDDQAAQMLSQRLQTQVKSKQVAQGDVRVEVRSPFQMFIDPLCDSFPEAEWLFEESIKSTQYAKRRYGVELKADTPANPGLVQGRLMGSVQGKSGYMGAKIREFWSQPCDDYPNGAQIVYSQGKVLARDNKPFDPQPYVMLTGIPTPGRLWAMAPMELLRGPQTKLNKTLSQMSENQNRIGNPTLAASKQAVQDPEKFEEATMQPGGVYYYDETGSQNAVPSYIVAPPLPEYVDKSIDRDIQALEDISGQHEVTNAHVPPGVTAASAITLLQEADDTRLGLAMQDYETNIGRFGTKVLKLVGRYYDSARTVQLAGDNGAWEIFDFKGSMLRGNTRVLVQAGSAFPQSKAMKQAMTLDMMNFLVQSGNAPHGRQLAQFLRGAGLGAYDGLVADYTTTDTQINRENALMSVGIPQQVNEYDDDEQHIEGHEDFQRQPRYALFNPLVQQLIEQHVGQHRQKVQQQQQQQLEQQLQLEGQLPPNMTAAAVQNAQQLSQIQGTQQDQQAQALQALMQAHGAQQQQDSQGAQAGDQRRQAEEQHQQRLQHQQEMHEARVAQIRKGSQ